MSNLHNTPRLPLQSSTTNKSKSRLFSALTNDLIERKTRALEGSLNKLKLTTQQNKTKFSIGTYRPIANKGTLQHASHAPRDKPAVNSFSTKPTPIKQIIKCGQCDKHDAKMKCLECTEMYCSHCFAQFHLRGALQRHHSILLSDNRFSPLTKQQQSSSAGHNLRDSYQRQSDEDVHRRTTMALHTHELGETVNEKPSFASFQQSFLQWRDNNINKSKRKHGLITETNELPNIEFNPLKTSSQDNFLSKIHRYTDKNNQQSKQINITKTNQPKIGVLVNIHQSFSDNTDLIDPSIDLEPSDDNLLTSRTDDSIRTISIEENSNNESIFEQERPITHVSTKSISRPNSSAIKNDSTSSRPNSTTVFQQSLRSVLATKSNDELEAIVDSQLILSRSSSSTVGKHDQPATVLNQNKISEHNTSNNTDVQSTITAHLDLSDKTKTELPIPLNSLSDNILPMISEKDESSTQALYMNSARTVSGHNSPFSFSFALNKTSRLNSASSRDTGDGGFFTEVLPRQIVPSPIPPPPILECSTSNEWKHTLEDQTTEQLQTRPDAIPLRKSSVGHISRPSSKHSVTLEQIHQPAKSQTVNKSRPSSSLSSSSLPVSVTSSKPDFVDSKIQSSATSSRENSSSSTSTIKNSSSTTSTTEDSSSSASTLKNSSTSTSKDSSSSATSTPKNVPPIKNSSPEPEPTASITIEEKKVTPPPDDNQCLHQSMNSLKEKSSSDVDTSQNPNNSSKSSPTTTLIRDENMIVNDKPVKKRTHRRRQTTTSNESSKFRKLGFSIGDGLKWQEVSMESMSSTKTTSSDQSSHITTPRSLTPSNPTHTKLTEQFDKYGNDDGRSSRTYQNVNDEEYFNQLREEFCSQLDTRGSDEDAILNDQILKILQGARLPLIEKDNETAQQPSIDNELLIN